MDEETTKVLTRGQKKQLNDDINELEQKDACMLARLRGRRNGASLPRGCHAFLMEIFAGAALLAALAMTWDLQLQLPLT